jgi:cytoskeletal protein CcmA (bactofilin family)
MKQVSMHKTYHRSLTVTFISALFAGSVLALFPMSSHAASSWAPTLLVNTEAFQRIDLGNGSTDIELQFGASTKTLKFIFSTQQFQFSHSLRVLGSISGSSLRISGAADIQGPLAVSGSLRTDGNISINDDQGAVDAVLTFGNNATTHTITFLNTQQVFRFSKGISVLGTISGSSLVIDHNAQIGGTLSASGSLALEGSLTGATIAGFGLTSCNSAGRSLQWNSITSKFECATSSGASNGSGGILSLHPTYPNAIYFGSGTVATTVGQLTASGSVADNENFYHWQTTRGTIQDYWISVRVRLQFMGSCETD